MSPEESKVFAEKHANETMQWAGDLLMACPQEALVVGWIDSVWVSQTIVVRLTKSVGWQHSRSSTMINWVVDPDPTDPPAYRYVAATQLIPIERTIAKKYPNFPHKCPACGEPAYIGLYTVDCISLSCTHFSRRG